MTIAIIVGICLIPLIKSNNRLNRIKRNVTPEQLRYLEERK